MSPRQPECPQDGTLYRASSSPAPARPHHRGPRRGDRREGLPGRHRGRHRAPRRASPATPSTRTSPPRKTASSPPRSSPSKRRCAASSTPPAGSTAWPARVNAGLAAFLHYVATEPALARTCIVEALSAGPAAVERYERSIQAFVPLFRMGRKVAPKGEEPAGDTRGDDRRRDLLDHLPAHRDGAGGGDRAAPPRAGRVLAHPLRRRRGRQADRRRAAETAGPTAEPGQGSGVPCASARHGDPRSDRQLRARRDRRGPDRDRRRARLRRNDDRADPRAGRPRPPRLRPPLPRQVRLLPLRLAGA